MTNDTHSAGAPGVHPHKRRLWACLTSIQAAAVRLDEALAGALLIADVTGSRAIEPEVADASDAMAAALRTAGLATKEVDMLAARGIALVGPVATKRGHGPWSA